MADLTHPFLDIDLDKIEVNCQVVTGLCREHGIEVAGVTKVVRGLPKVARALLRGGVAQLADSRLENIRRIRDDGIRDPVMLLRIPRLSDARAVVELTDFSLNSELSVIEALSEAALAAGKRHRVVLMIDTGDLREGVLPVDALDVAAQIAGMKGVELHGVGTNLACLSGIRPTRDNMELLADLADQIRGRLSLPLPMVSGGNSFNLPLLESGKMPAGINHLRLGSSILMGLLLSDETRARVRGDAFLLHAEILELKDKPSAPHGEPGEDAFGHRPRFRDEGTMRRAILGVGREDVVPEYLLPLDEGARVLGASSDHLVVDVTAVKRELRVGGEMIFDLDYGAVLAAMTSDYVHRNLIYAPSREPGVRKVRLLGVPRDRAGTAAADAAGVSAPGLIREQLLGEQLLRMGLEVVDAGDLQLAAAVAGDRSPDAPVAEAVFRALEAGETPLVLGGPHSLLHGELAGLTRFTPEFGLICFDAHGDLISTISAGWEGAPLSLSLENFALVGVRDLTDDERRLLEGSPITVFTMEDVDRRGMVGVMECCLEVALTAVDGLHVSVDIDFVDGRDAPAAIEPEPGGISYREAHLAMEMIAEARVLLSADLCEIDASHPAAAQTARLASGLLASLFGRKLLGRGG